MVLGRGDVFDRASLACIFPYCVILLWKKGNIFNMWIFSIAKKEKMVNKYFHIFYMYLIWTVKSYIYNTYIMIVVDHCW